MNSDANQISISICLYTYQISSSTEIMILPKYRYYQNKFELFAVLTFTKITNGIINLVGLPN